MGCWNTHRQEELHISEGLTSLSIPPLQTQGAEGTAGIRACLTEHLAEGVMLNHYMRNSHHDALVSDCHSSFSQRWRAGWSWTKLGMGRKHCGAGCAAPLLTLPPGIKLTAGGQGLLQVSCLSSLAHAFSMSPTCPYPFPGPWGARGRLAVPMSSFFAPEIKSYCWVKSCICRTIE